MIFGTSENKNKAESDFQKYYRLHWLFSGKKLH